MTRLQGSTPDEEGSAGLARGLLLAAVDPTGDGCQKALSYPEWRAAVATNQTLTQNGSSSASTGTTSAVEKPGIPALIGVALENGAIKDSVSGNTLTLTSTPMAITEAFLGIENGDCPSSICRQLGASATFNVASDSGSNPAASATRKNVTQWQLKYSFVDGSEYSKSAQQAFDAHLAEPLKNLAGALSAQELTSLDPLVNAILQTVTPAVVGKARNAAAASSETKFRAFTKTQQDQAIASLLQTLDADSATKAEVMKLANTPGVRQSLRNTLAARAAAGTALAAYKRALAETKPSWNGAITFSQQYPSTTVTTSGGSTKTEPTYLVPGLVISYDPGAAKPKAGSGPAAAATSPTPTLWNPSLTFNAGGSFYPNPLAAANQTTFRGATAALQLQWTLGRGPFLTNPSDNGQITLSLNGNYSRLQENQHQVGKKADIAIGNLKWEIPLPGGISFPLSLTIANSTDQIKETYVRGNFGLSFDLDKLQQLLKAAH